MSTKNFITLAITLKTLKRFTSYSIILLTFILCFTRNVFAVKDKNIAEFTTFENFSIKFWDLISGDQTLLDIIATIWVFLGDLWSYKIFTMDKQPITIGNIILGFVLAVIAFRLTRSLSRIIRRKLESFFALSHSNAESLERITYYFLLICSIVIVLDAINIPLTVFTFVGGALAIGVGFGSQNILNNFISGLIIMMEQPFKIGDLLEVENKIGRVIAIGARCVHLRTAFNIDVLVPNSAILQNTVVNLTLSNDINMVSNKINVSFDVDTVEVSELLKKAMVENTKILQTPEPIVYLVGTIETGFVFEMFFAIDLAKVSDKRLVLDEINQYVCKIFREHNIDFAQPIRVLTVVDKSNLSKIC